MRAAITICLMAFLVFLPWPVQSDGRSGGAAMLTIESNGSRHRFAVEIADTPALQARGLMFRRDLARDAGMLLVYETEATVTMWMKNTYLPLDMLFIAADGRIIHIVERTVPLSTQIISSRKAALAVLELNGGTVSRLAIAVGDKVRHNAFKNSE
jgi:uncharacterized membrane protein (UPF0127 family)